MNCKTCVKRESVVGKDRKSFCSISGEQVWGYAQKEEASPRCPLVNGKEISETNEPLQQDNDVKVGDVVEPNPEQQPVVTEAPTTTTPTPAPVPPTTTAAPQQYQAKQQQNQNNRK
jgi:hypothetical protein